MGVCSSSEQTIEKPNLPNLPNLIPSENSAFRKIHDILYPEKNKNKIEIVNKSKKYKK